MSPDHTTEAGGQAELPADLQKLDDALARLRGIDVFLVQWKDGALDLSDSDDGERTKALLAGLEADAAAVYKDIEAVLRKKVPRKQRKKVQEDRDLVPKMIGELVANGAFNPEQQLKLDAVLESIGQLEKASGHVLELSQYGYKPEDPKTTWERVSESPVGRAVGYCINETRDLVRGCLQEDIPKFARGFAAKKPWGNTVFSDELQEGAVALMYGKDDEPVEESAREAKQTEHIEERINECARLVGENGNDAPAGVEKDRAMLQHAMEEANKMVLAVRGFAEEVHNAGHVIAGDEKRRLEESFSHLVAAIDTFITRYTDYIDPEKKDAGVVDTQTEISILTRPLMWLQKALEELTNTSRLRFMGKSRIVPLSKSLAHRSGQRGKNEMIDRQSALRNQATKVNALVQVLEEARMHDGTVSSHEFTKAKTTESGYNPFRDSYEWLSRSFLTKSALIAALSTPFWWGSTSEEKKADADSTKAAPTASQDPDTKNKAKKTTAAPQDPEAIILQGFAIESAGGRKIKVTVPIPPGSAYKINDDIKFYVGAPHATSKKHDVVNGIATVRDDILPNGGTVKGSISVGGKHSPWIDVDIAAK